MAPDGFALTLTVGATFGFTVMVIPLGVTVAGETQMSAEGVITTVTTSPFFKREVVNVELVAPVETPLVFHW